MLENVDASSASGCEGESDNTSKDYLRRAVQACDAGDAVLGMHLYLAAFEKAQTMPGAPDSAAVEGLKTAWSLACGHKERSLAEYIFEKLEPFLSQDEMAACADELQELALDKLEEYGLSRAELADMTQAISQDILGSDALLSDARLVKVERISEPSLLEGLAAMAPKALGKPGLHAGGRGDAPAADKANESVAGGGSSAHGDSAGANAAGTADAEADGKDGQDALSPSDKKKVSALVARAAEAAGMKPASQSQRLTYNDLAGYGNVIKVMRDFGVGMQDDPEFLKLVDLLNARFGLDRMPVADTLLFCSPAREDASRFMAATVGELGLPAVRMRMDENLQGMPILCVMTQAEGTQGLNVSHGEIVGGAVVVLEDIDMWPVPESDMGDDFGGFLMVQLSRGAREAINLIRSAVDNPDVYVLASASDEHSIDPFFLDLLEPASVVDIDLPTPEDRIEIWMDLAHTHPSLRAINRADLVRYSAGMPRFDIYMAVREAIEEAYKESLLARRYVPVTRENLFEKLAAYQPLESDEYHALEEAVLRNFRADLEHIDDLLK